MSTFSPMDAPRKISTPVAVRSWTNFLCCEFQNFKNTKTSQNLPKFGMEHHHQVLWLAKEALGNILSLSSSLVWFSLLPSSAC